MTVIDAIKKWAKELPAWQQYAVQILLSKTKLTSVDEDAIFMKLRAEYGLLDDLIATSSSEENLQELVTVTSEAPIKFLSISDVTGVNALANDQIIEFNREGLTVVYGANGSGKSGYTRLLKHACHARDRSELIKPNVHSLIEATKPSATFNLLVAGDEQSHTWAYGDPPSAALASLAVFDSHCSRAYLDRQGEFSYEPAGFDIFRELVRVIDSFNAKLKMELSHIPLVDAGFPYLRVPGTKVGSLIANLSKDTPPAEVTKLASLSLAEADTHAALRAQLAETTPLEKAVSTRATAARFSSIADSILRLKNLVMDEQAKSLYRAVQDSNTAKIAAGRELSAFNSLQGLLAGVAGDAWQALFRSAEAYAQESLPTISFKALSHTDPCPLCMQPLGEAAGKLMAISKHISAEAAVTAIDMRLRARKLFMDIRDTDYVIPISADLQGELAHHLPNITAQIAAFCAVLGARAATICQACHDPENAPTLQALPTCPSAPLLAAATELERKAKTLTQLADPASRVIAQGTFDELAARLRLVEVHDLILKSIQDRGLRARLEDCSRATMTTSISRKASEISKEAITQDLGVDLNRELRSLGVENLCVQFKSVNKKGVTEYKLAIEAPGDTSGSLPSEILSEGEQRAIVLAAFFVDLGAARQFNAIVFDDPMSSLDAERRTAVAERIVVEAKIRQVLVFTHDLFFAKLLDSSATAAECSCCTRALTRTQLNVGVVQNTLPVSLLSCKKRIVQLKKDLQKLQLRREANATTASLERDIKTIYAELREAWESGVEEVLFAGTVRRFDRAIHTKKLERVNVLPADKFAINEAMTKTSTFSGHSAPTEGNVPIPSLENLSEDIEKFATWVRSKA